MRHTGKEIRAVCTDNFQTVPDNESEVKIMHKIKAAFIGEGGLLETMIGAVLERELLPPENILLSQDCEEEKAFEGKGVTYFSDTMNAVVKAEIVVVCASKKRELGTALAPITGCTRGRILIALCPDVDVAYIAERVVKGTAIRAAPVRQDEDGAYHTMMEFSKDFLPFQVEPCRDILGSVCVLDDFA